MNTVRNLTGGISIVVKQSPQDRVEKEATLRLVVASAIAMKLHLRHEAINDELASLISSPQYVKLKDMNHLWLEIAFWIGDYLQHQHEHNCLNIYQLNSLHKFVDDLVDILGGCEGILKTPMPLAYASKFKQLLLIYCLLLPLELVSVMNWWTGVIMAFVSFTLFGIEQIGAEIEEAFGYDPNDLPLDVICNTIRRNVEDLIANSPSSAGDWRL